MMQCSVLNRFSKVSNEMEHVEKLLGHNKYNEVDVLSSSSDDSNNADDDKVVD